MGEKIKQIIDQFGFQEVNGEIDLREYSNENVLEFLDTLEKTNAFVFHGSNSLERYNILEARQANDEAKESGNKKAVYADAGIMVPLASAILNKAYLKSIFESYTTSWGNDNGKMIFEFSSQVYKLFKIGDSHLFSDGYIYVLDRSSFVSAPDAGQVEWHAESDQKPILSIRISRKMATDVFIISQGEKDNVFEYK